MSPLHVQELHNMSTLKVNTIRHTGASSDAVTLASDGTCTAKITNNLSNRNLIINGSCIVAQRSSSPVTDDAYRTVDRFRIDYSGADNHPTQAQHELTSSDTGPWEKGFRFSYHLTNGDQTSGAGTGDFMAIDTRLESRDIANSGWNYTSASSYITLSFWVKSSVAQNFYGQVESDDGTAQNYPFETGSLSANTWTKVTKTIPGNSNFTFFNNEGLGLKITLWAFAGTNLTGSVSLNTWAAYSASTRTPDNTSTWWTTNDATLEITGVQLEVGDVATDFEHRSYGDELARCQRYYQQIGATGQDGSYTISAGYLYDNGNKIAVGYAPPVSFRTTPTMTNGSTTLQAKTPGAGTENVTSYNFIEVVEPSTWIAISGVSGGDLGNDHDICLWTCPSNGLVQMSAEL